MTTKTAHAYIVKNNAICGGSPIVKGTRIPVKAIVGYYKMGLSVDDLLDGFPNLTAAQIHDALSYYHDHQGEIERDLRRDRLDHVLKSQRLTLAPTGELRPKG